MQVYNKEVKMKEEIKIEEGKIVNSPHFEGSNHCSNWGAVIVSLDPRWGFKRAWLSKAEPGCYYAPSLKEGDIIEIGSREYSCSHKTIKREKVFLFVVKNKELQPITPAEAKKILIERGLVDPSKGGEK